MYMYLPGFIRYVDYRGLTCSHGLELVHVALKVPVKLPRRVGHLVPINILNIGLL